MPQALDSAGLPKRAAAAITLLEDLIAIQSFSREEDATATCLTQWMSAHGVRPQRSGNNVWASYASAGIADDAPTLLLNSHHDTVRPGDGWTSDPFVPTWQGERLVGLGSNDAGGPLVALLAAFAQLVETQAQLPFRVVVAATAEEEVSGAGGIASILPRLGPIACGIVGEPTGLHAAVSEKGLVVLDGEAKGRTGHAARSEGINALYRGLDDVAKLRAFRFPKASPTLGEILVTVTQFEAGSQHNVVPDTCRYVVDVRTTDAYSNEDTVGLLRQCIDGTLTPRSTRLMPSGLSPKHSLYRSAVEDLGLAAYGSPTLSDQALMPFPTLKLGPGESARSHTPNEYILCSEVEQGITVYDRLLQALAVRGLTGA